MKVEFRESFLKDLERVRDVATRRRIREIIEQVEAAETLSDIANLKKRRGSDRYYRIRTGDYRIGLILERDSVVFVRFLHRKEIYRYFP